MNGTNGIILLFKRVDSTTSVIKYAKQIHTEFLLS